MNPDLLETVKNLKLHGFSDSDIHEATDTKYGHNEVQDCIDSLSQLKPDTNVGERHKKRFSKSVKISFASVIGIVLLLVFIAWPLVMRANTNRTAEALKNKLSEIYQTDIAYKLGSEHDCVLAQPVRFGDITDKKICKQFTAYLFYIPFQVKSVTSRLYNEKKEKTENYVEYINTKGESIDSYTNNYGKYERPVTDAMKKLYPVNEYLNIETRDSIEFARTSKILDTPSEYAIGGIWEWLGSGNTDWDYSKELQTKIVANESLGKDIPLPIDELNNDRAPLVVYITDYYCHSPNIIFVDQSCIVPF